MKIFSLKDSMSPVSMPANPINNVGGSMDPVTIISAVSAGWSLISNIFGSGRKALTMTDWNQMFPYSGTWYNKLKSYYAAHIKYNTDENNISSYLMYFLYDSGVVDTSNPNVSQRETAAMTWFNQELAAERSGIQTGNTGYVSQPTQTGGSGVVTTTTGPGGTVVTSLGTAGATISSPIFLIGGAALLAILLLK